MALQELRFEIPSEEDAEALYQLLTDEFKISEVWLNGRNIRVFVVKRK